MTNLRKITEEEVKEYVQELGDMETEHRKGSTFYASCAYMFKENDIKTLEEEGVDASAFLNILVTLNGIYDDWNGCDWDNQTTYEKVEEYEEHVPEKVIPAHTVTKTRTTAFKPVWE